MFYLELNRVYLREFNYYDLDDLYEICRNPNVGPNAGWPSHKNKEETKKVLIDLIKRKDSLAIVDKKSNKLIGSIGLYKDNKREDPYSKMIGYVLNESFWGKGIMSEVVLGYINFIFKNTQIVLLSIYHFPSNIRSKRVIEKCGFKFEGVLRNATCLYNGQVVDNYCYSLTRKEYNSWPNIHP